MEKPTFLEDATVSATPAVRYVLPVCTSQRPDGERVARVLCPRTGHHVEIGECGRCSDCLGLTLNVSGFGTLLKCAWQHSVKDDAEDSGSELPRLTLGPTVGELMTRAPCAGPETPLNVLAHRMLRQGICAVTVLDERGKAIGVVSASDLLRRSVDDDAGAIRTEPHPLATDSTSVTEVMNGLVLGLSTDASVARASALMAYEGVDQLVVFDDEGNVAGVISALDILRWHAATAGFVVPRASGPEDP